jgi:dihydroxyacetone kinase-like protein
MKKIINNPSDFVEESIQGLVISHPDIYSFATDNERVIKRTVKAKNKVGIVSGGGSGHLPVFTGYVGKGMLDACAVGSVFASPSVDQIASAIRNGDNGNGVLCVLGNYGGDVMNFEMACEIVKDEGIETKTIIVSDDIASASSEEKLKRRGIAGLILAFKIAGATAESGASLEEVFNITSNANSNLRTIGVAVSSCILPEVGKPTFNLESDEIEIGMGIHGEPGIKREKLKKADILVDDLCEIIFKDFELLSKDKVSIMINSLGATPLEELYIVSKRVNEIFSKLEIDIVKSYVGRYATSLEMAGMSITVLKLNDDLSKALLDHSECPFWIN